MQHYTGVGSRRTPTDILMLMQETAGALHQHHRYTLRSGGANGADSAFQRGAFHVHGEAEIYRPRGKCQLHEIGSYVPDLWDKAMQMAEAIHPAWYACSAYARMLHARNCFQVLGRDLDTPSKFLVCWTPDGAATAGHCSRETGGTGTAIRLASGNGIPVFNLKNADTLTRIKKWLRVPQAIPA